MQKKQFCDCVKLFNMIDLAFNSLLNLSREMKSFDQGFGCAFYKLFLNEEKIEKNRVRLFQPLARSFEEIDFLNNYYNNLRNVLYK